MGNLEIALNLARLGYYVHPLAPKSQMPIAEHGSNDATRDEGQISAWWQATPNALSRPNAQDKRHAAHGVIYLRSAWHTWYRLLRHSCATFLIVQGVSPRVVMEYLGHSQIGVTMNIYAHVLPSSMKDAADTMAGMFIEEDDQ